MALILTREVLFHCHAIKSNLLGSLLALATRRTALIFDCGREICTGKSFGRFQVLDAFCEQHQVVTLRHFSTSIQPGRLCWEGSTHAVLLKRLEIALKHHHLDEAWVTFTDFKSLYGFPADSVVSRLITELSYSSDPRWLQKACDLVFLILKEKSDLLRPEILTKLSLSFARARMPILASMILRVMLERESMPPINILCLVIFHMVKTEVGACLASNFLVQICDCYLCLSANRSDLAKVIKPDTMIFNLILDACVRFKSSLKGQQLLELMSQTGVIADVHSINIIAQIHEMNGQRDEIRKFKDYIDQVSSSFVYHYQQFYDSLLNLHFKFDDIDAAAKLVLDMHRSRGPIPNQKIRKDIQKPYLVPIGSHNLRSGLKLQIVPELLQKDSVIVEHKPELVIFRNGKLFLSSKGLAKLINARKRHGRIIELAELLLSIQKDFYTPDGSNLCSDVINACICLGWLETAHDILDDMDKAGASLGSSAYMALLTAYYNKEMFKEAKALLRQIRKAGLLMNWSDEMIACTCPSAAAVDSASSSTSESDLCYCLVQEMREGEKDITPMVYELNSSIFFFCKAKMMGDALKTYRRMQKMKIQPTVQTFAYLAHGFSSLERYRDITILWGDIKRNMEGRNLVVSMDLYELLLLNFLRGGYFERVMEVIGYMKEHNMYTDKWMCKSEFWKLHKNLYKNLKASEARTEAQSKRVEFVQKFRKWVGLD